LYIVLFLILINSLVLSLYYYEMPDSLLNVLDNINVALTVAFLLELILKLLGLGLKDFFKQPFNIFDAIIVILSLLEFINVSSKSI